MVWGPWVTEHLPSALLAVWVEAGPAVVGRGVHLEALRMERLSRENGEERRGAGVRCWGAPVLREDQALGKENKSKQPVSLPAPSWL